MVFRRYPSDVGSLAQVSDYPGVRQLRWFNRGFMKAEQRDGQLVLSDLRMGAEPDYTFRFKVAEREGSGWREVPAEQQQWPWDTRRQLQAMWNRIWTESASRPDAVPGFDEEVRQGSGFNALP